MEYVVDLHLHSKYSRAVSPLMTLPDMARVGRQKGIDILSAADWTHPAWFTEISTHLEEAAEGLYTLIGDTNPRKQYFFLSTEIASIYTQGNKLRRIHNLVFAPSLTVAASITKELLKRGANLSADGRPIIGLSARDLLELILTVDERCLLIPCHVWTPHFGVYGSASGFDSLDEAFGELSRFVYGIETGLSSDPEMNWTMKELRNRSILSFSDAHSLPKMAREATVMQLEEPTYSAIRQAIMQPFETDTHVGGPIRRTKNRVSYTIEFYPEEGKYHFSGHRNCSVIFTPDQTRELHDMCPVCGRKLTEGVFVRVGQLGGQAAAVLEIKTNESGLQWFTDKTHHHPPYVKLVPLLEICAESLHSTVQSQKSKNLFTLLCETFGSELKVLLKTPIDELAGVGGNIIASGVDRVRRGQLNIKPGYDGVYGKVAIWSDDMPVSSPPQMPLL